MEPKSEKNPTWVRGPSGGVSYEIRSSFLPQTLVKAGLEYIQQLHSTFGQIHGTDFCRENLSAVGLKY